MIKSKPKTIGILWVGGKSSRFRNSTKIDVKSSNKSKIYALLKNKPLFFWVLNALSAVVDNCVLSFNSFNQYETFKEYIDQSSINIQHFSKVIDSPSIISKGPLQAQLTVLNEYKEARMILTVSSDMPFIPTMLLRDLSTESTTISTVQTPNQILEPLVSSYLLRKMRFGVKFLSKIPFGRADDLHRGVDSLSVYIPPPNYPSKRTPWNLNINYKHELEELNLQREESNDRKVSMDDPPPKIKKKTILNSSNNSSKLSDIVQGDLDQHLNESESFKTLAYDELVQAGSYFYGGKYAEYIAYHSKLKEKVNNWYLKAATSYWEETQLWLNNDIPFLAIHSLKDCQLSIKRSNHNVSFLSEVNQHFSKLSEQLKLSKGGF